MIVYHGTDSFSARNIVDKGIDLSYGDESVDNAQGFYMTPSIEFASRRAKTTTASMRTADDDEFEPVILEIEIDEDSLKELNVKKFDGCSYEWKEFVFYNRLGRHFLNRHKILSNNHNLDFKFDVVIDETADSGVSGIISRMRYKETRGDTDLKSAILKIQKSNDASWDKQISFYSQRAVKQCIKSIQIIKV